MNDCIPCRQKRKQLIEAVKDVDPVEAAKLAAQGAAMLIGKIVTMAGTKYKVDDNGELKEIDK